MRTILQPPDQRSKSGTIYQHFPQKYYTILQAATSAKKRGWNWCLHHLKEIQGFPWLKFGQIQGLCWYHLKHYLDQLLAQIRQSDGLGSIPRALIDRFLKICRQYGNLGASSDPPLWQWPKSIHSYPRQLR